MEALLFLEASDGLEKELHPSEECGAADIWEYEAKLIIETPKGSVETGLIL